MTTNVYDLIIQRRAQLQREHDEAEARAEAEKQAKRQREIDFASIASQWLAQEEGVVIPPEWWVCTSTGVTHRGEFLYKVRVNAPDEKGWVELCADLYQGVDGNVKWVNKWGHGMWQGARRRSSNYYIKFIEAADYAFPDPPDAPPEPRCPSCNYPESQGHADDCENDPRNVQDPPIVEPGESDHPDNLAAWHLAQVGAAVEAFLNVRGPITQSQAAMEAELHLDQVLDAAAEVVDWREPIEDDDDPHEAFPGVDAPNPYTHQINPADLDPNH